MPMIQMTKIGFVMLMTLFAHANASFSSHVSVEWSGDEGGVTRVMGGDNWRVSDEWSEMVIRVTPGPGQPSFLDRSPHVSDPVTSHVTRAM